MFVSPEENAKLGFLTRIELDKNSCKREVVVALEFTELAEGAGRDGIADDPIFVETYNAGLDLFDVEILDLSASSENSVELGDWETELEPALEMCTAWTSDTY